MNSWITEEGYFGNFKTKATDALKSPWKAGTDALTAFKTSAADQMSQVVKNVQSNVDKAKKSLDELYKKIVDTEKKAKDADVSVDQSPPETPPKTPASTSSGVTIYSLYGITNDEILAAGLGPVSLEGFENMLKNYEIGLYVQNGKNKVRKASASEKRKKMLTEIPAAISGPTAVKKHAKGTLGTKQDEWAITDESWIGEEITLAAGKHGQLQYLKKGSAVMPADISANLVEWGKLDPSSFTMPGVGSVLNNIVNSVMQPNYEFNFDSLVHVDHCDEGTLKNLEKMVDTKLNDFGKQLNYSIKKFAR